LRRPRRPSSTRPQTPPVSVDFEYAGWLRPTTGDDDGVRVPWHFELGGFARDNTSHLLARTAFRRLILQDPRVCELFEWNGLMATAVNLAARADRVAVSVGLQHRGEFFSGRLSEGLAAHPDVSTVVNGVHGCLQALPGFVVPTERFVRGTLRLPWPWLVRDLSKIFVDAVVSILVCRVVLVHELEPTVGHVLDVTRLERAALNVNHAMMKSSQVERRGVRPTAATIDRDVEWFYRAILKDPKDTIGALARDYYSNHPDPAMLTGKAKDHRPTVKAGIARARHLLADVPLFV